MLPQVEQMKKDDMVVVELSSFQLMDMDRSPHIAVMTNLSPNHLDIHKDMEEYVVSKENIYLHQNAEDTVILNMDNEITNRFVSKAKGHVFAIFQSETSGEGILSEGRSDDLPSRWIAGTGDYVRPRYFNSRCA